MLTVVRGLRSSVHATKAPVAATITTTGINTSSGTGAPVIPTTAVAGTTAIIAIIVYGDLVRPNASASYNNCPVDQH